MYYLDIKEITDSHSFSDILLIFQQELKSNFPQQFYYKA